MTTLAERHEADQDDADRVRARPAEDAQEPLPNVRTVTTVNSVYQINEADHMIRRMHGRNEATPRQGVDEVWQAYDSIMPHLGGLLIVWDQTTGKCTWTSDVVGDASVRQSLNEADNRRAL